MKIGLLKSKVETLLVESMNDNTFKKEILNFKKIVLEDKDMAKAFYLYDTITSKKGLSQDDAHEFVNECIRQYEKIKFNDSKIKQLLEWVKDIKSENSYSDVDTIFDDSYLVESIVSSKKKLVNELSKKEKQQNQVNIPIQKVFEVATNSAKEYLNNLSENDLKSLKKYMTLTESELSSRYDLLSEMTIEKLNSMITESDSQTKDKIQSVIDRISTDEKNQINLIKLKQLYNSL